MAVIRSALLVSATLTAPTAFMVPPLDSGPVRQEVLERRTALAQYSMSALAGKSRYEATCAVCHGKSGDGTSFAPSLLPLVVGWQSGAAERFHGEVAGIPHKPVGFNDVEMIARYLREVGKKQREA
ncbi:MAG: cytochrome c [Pseudomonadota bacterium]